MFPADDADAGRAPPHRLRLDHVLSLQTGDEPAGPGFGPLPAFGERRDGLNQLAAVDHDGFAGDMAASGLVIGPQEQVQPRFELRELAPARVQRVIDGLSPELYPAAAHAARPSPGK